MKAKIKTKAGDILKVWKEVFSKARYIIFAVIFAAVFYMLDIFFANFKTITNLVKDRGFFTMLSLFPSFMTSYPKFFPAKFFISLLIISGLFGLLFSLIAYRTKMLKTASGKTNALVSLGIFLGILAPGCPACSIGILSVLGLSSAVINFLPFNGFGLVLLSGIVMVFSVYKISGDINKGIVCEVPLAIEAKKAKK